jgi:archaea-specific RecJ-like exonuclease
MANKKRMDFKKSNFNGKKFNKPDFKRKEFGRSSFGERREDYRRDVDMSTKSVIQIKDISLDTPSKESLVISGIVDRIVQTGGPTIFFISDGTGTLTSTAFLRGQRAYPEINEGNAVKALVSIEEFQGEVEGQIKQISKLSDAEQTIFKREIEKIQEKRAKVQEVPFLIKSQILDKLREKMIDAAYQIRLAIIQNRPIIIRHHNDTDGYCAGYALERAVLPLIEQEHDSNKAEWEFFVRAPSAAPFYEIDDSIRDTATSLRNVAKFSNKLPLIIITDNGSTPEDLFGIQQGKAHGIQFVVIDHHYFDNDVISPQVLVHVNPFLVGEDGSRFSAGMLCTELARLINPTQGIEQIPALAGLADKIDLQNPEAIAKYLKIAEDQGYSKELLCDISLVIDFVSAKVKFMEAREYMGGIFGEPKERQEKLVNLMAPYIKELNKKGLDIAKANAKSEKIGKTTLQLINIEATFPGFGFYPKPGKCVSMIHDDLQLTGKVNNLVTIGYSSTSITMRATDGANFSVHELIKFLNENSPMSFVAGGGHKNAGSITFIPPKKEEILVLLREFIGKR